MHFAFHPGCHANFFRLFARPPGICFLQADSAALLATHFGAVNVLTGKFGDFLNGRIFFTEAAKWAFGAIVSGHLQLLRPLEVRKTFVESYVVNFVLIAVGPILLAALLAGGLFDS